MYISHMITALTVAVTSAGVDWKALLSAPQLASLHQESRVLVVFRTGRTVAVFFRDTAGGADLIEVPIDTGDLEQHTLPVWRWSKLPAFLRSASNVSVTMELYAVEAGA